jgi:hypothetical protein
MPHLMANGSTAELHFKKRAERWFSSLKQFAIILYHNNDQPNYNPRK